MVRLRALALSLAALASAAGCGPFDEVGDCPTPCTGNSVCLADTCVTAFPRTYELVLGVSLASEDPDGACWDDPFCGAPDPQVTLRIDGVEVARTTEASDSYSHRWTEAPVRVTFDNPGKVVELVAMDIDVDLNDAAARCSGVTITAAVLRSGQISCPTMAGGSDVFADVTPLAGM